ncbi:MULTISPECIES: hypothetical protein [unclassified Streptomyces]|uniref:hypothetical protein n=1 Tax=unclassified Streptomyces TaxID=2593676 RepID=UPI002E28FF0C|nr:hypothetical protein [Streptomyces sp. NBC_00223]
MSGPAKSMAVCTLVCLVAVVGYTVALGSSSWLWSAWVVLALCTAGVAAIRVRR